MNKYKLTKNNNIVELHFECNDLTYNCKLHLETEAWAELEVWDMENCGYAFTAYRHINDMVFCVIDSQKGDKWVDKASYWHSCGNLFDVDNLHWSEQQKVDETIDVFTHLVEEQLELYKKL